MACHGAAGFERIEQEMRVDLVPECQKLRLLLRKFAAVVLGNQFLLAAGVGIEIFKCLIHGGNDRLEFLDDRLRKRKISLGNIADLLGNPADILFDFVEQNQNRQGDGNNQQQDCCQRNIRDEISADMERCQIHELHRRVSQGRGGCQIPDPLIFQIRIMILRNDGIGEILRGGNHSILACQDGNAVCSGSGGVKQGIDIIDDAVGQLRLAVPVSVENRIDRADVDDIPAIS